MNAVVAGPSLYTVAKKRIYSLGRLLQGRPSPANVAIACVGHDVVGPKNGTLKLVLDVHARGPGHALDGATIDVDWVSCKTGAIVSTTTTAVPCQVLRGQTERVTVRVPVPGVLGRFQLTYRGPSGDPVTIPSPIEVVAAASENIDYVALYRNVDLEKDHWYVVGPSTEAEHHRLAAEKLEQLKAAGLTPDMAVFDVGCGTGQLALSLEKYLSDRGRYFGCDIGAEGIAHCRARFQRPNFSFAISGMTTLPKTAGEFDFVTLFSVFTHTLADETMLLLAEMKRTLKPTGCVYADVYFNDLVEGYAGNRGRIEYERDYWLRMLDLVGFVPATANAWQVEPHVRREVFVLRKR
jgi:ubiquinone/menaquinone biosynthesis C-methylase UbiE